MGHEKWFYRSPVKMNAMTKPFEVRGLQIDPCDPQDQISVRSTCGQQLLLSNSKKLPKHQVFFWLKKYGVLTIYSALINTC